MPQGPEFDDRQKGVIIAVLFLLMGITLIFGFVQLRSSVRRPFVRQDAGGTSVVVSPEQQEEAQRLALTQKDTDNDGLSDYDELYVTLTSPYLPDSDSDGISDKEEIERGGDPNCPQGTTCAETPPPVASSPKASSPPGTDVSSVFDQLQKNEQQKTVPPLLAGQASPDEIRAILKKAGVADDLLAAMDDAALQELYEETIQELTTGSLLPQ